jgi:hypothetical protein
MTPEFRVFDVLQRHGVPCVVVGGHAVNFHGFIRAASDSCRSSGCESSSRRQGDRKTCSTWKTCPRASDRIGSRGQDFLDADAAADMLAWEKGGFSEDGCVRISLIDRDVPFQGAGQSAERCRRRRHSSRGH